MGQSTTNRFSPYRFAGGKTTKNRIVVPPMCSRTADERGNATPATIAHYARLAQSGAGIVFVEYSFVHPSGKGEDNQLAADSDANLDGLTKVADAIHRTGALAGHQLVHVGGKTTKAMIGGELMSPSGIRVPVRGWEPDVPVEMNLAGIRLWLRWFAGAALRAQAAGFDLVELHAAHGYGLNQWLSPLTNRRTDAYGGSMAARGRILFEIIDSVRAAAPGLLLSVRLPGQDHMDGGLTTADMGWLVNRLESIGMDLIDVSSGIGGWRRPEGRAGEGYLVNDAAALKPFTTLPVIGVGGIETGSFIDQVLGEGRADFAAVGRAILRDPYAWGRNQLSGVETLAMTQGGRYV